MVGIGGPWSPQWRGVFCQFSWLLCRQSEDLLAATPKRCQSASIQGVPADAVFATHNEQDLWAATPKRCQSASLQGVPADAVFATQNEH